MISLSFLAVGAFFVVFFSYAASLNRQLEPPVTRRVLSTK